jgi:hypothetical protein
VQKYPECLACQGLGARGSLLQQNLWIGRTIDGLTFLKRLHRRPRSGSWSCVSASTASMGRYDFRPHRVHQATTQLLAAERLARRPPWYETVGAVRPPQILVRTQPVRLGPRGKTLKCKASKIFQPVRLIYPEDRLRKAFFADHPWELARPRMVLEDDAKDGQRRDWASIIQESKPLDGERYARGPFLLSDCG